LRWDRLISARFYQAMTGPSRHIRDGHDQMHPFRFSAVDAGCHAHSPVWACDARPAAYNVQGQRQLFTPRPRLQFPFVWLLWFPEPFEMGSFDFRAFL